jgi:diaminohydroxyphosphoribosylaminopyrimidine deaminase / 5-amino-6-(5-phosphoribosylamino)uracil reductase
MGAALALAERTRGRTAPNPNVGCVIVKDKRVVGRGWTQARGRPHAEAVALEEAGEAARGATVYVTLEPCAHVSARGPTCADLLVAAGVTRVVAAVGDPDPRTDGRGLKVLDVGGVATDVGVCVSQAHRSMAGFFTRRAFGRPHVTLKLALSLDGCIALASGESKWITGPEARAHVHLERSRHEAILVGRGTYEADAPALDVRLAGLEGRSPRRFVLSSQSPNPKGRHPSEGWDLSVSTSGEGAAGDPSLRWGDGFGPGDGSGWEVIDSPHSIADLDGVDHLFVEGGAGAAATFLRADLVDRLLLYRAPIVIGGGRSAVGDLDMTTLTEAHGKWKLHDARALGSDRLEVYERVRE